MSIFVASAFVLFMSPVKNAFAHPASPAVAKAFSAQAPQDPNEQDAQNNDAPHEDMDDRDIDNIEDGAKDGIDNGAVKDAGVHETDGANNDEDRQADQVEDGEVPPPPAA
jgi:hypothetical protein